MLLTDAVTANVAPQSLVLMFGYYVNNYIVKVRSTKNSKQGVL